MLSFNNSAGNLYNVLGKCGLLIKQAGSYTASQQTNLTNTTTGLVAQLNSQSDIQAQVGNSYIGLLNAAGASPGGMASNIAQLIINRLVFQDNPQLAQTLQQLSLNTSITEVIRQMKIAGATIQAATITAVPGAFNAITANVGNGVINTSTKRPIDGLVLENTFAEQVLAACSSDSYTGTASAGHESFQITGTGSANVFDFNWPLGSNCSTSLSVIDGNSSNSNGNGLNNSGFNLFTGNVPTNWTLEVGTSGTQINKEVSIVYDGVAAVKLTGDGSNLTAFSQTFNSSTGTTAQLSPTSQYSVCLFARRDGTAAGAGTLVVELTDSSGTVIKDVNNVNNSFSIDLTTLTTNYASYTGVFRTPVILPSSSKIRLRLSTALTASRSVYLDKLSMGLMTQTYPSGPYFAVHAGSVPFAVGDYTYTPITNSRGTGGTLASFQTLLARLYPIVLSNGILFPSATGGANTISDSVLIA